MGWDGIKRPLDVFTGNETPVIPDGLGHGPPAGQPKLIKQGMVLVTSDASAAFSFNFHDGQFPNGVVSVVVSIADNANVTAVRQNRALSNAAGYAGFLVLGTGGGSQHGNAPHLHRDRLVARPVLKAVA